MDEGVTRPERHVNQSPGAQQTTQQQADTNTQVHRTTIASNMNLRPPNRLRDPIRGMISGLLPRLNNEYIIPGPDGNQIINISIANGQHGNGGGHSHAHMGTHGHSHHGSVEAGASRHSLNSTTGLSHDAFFAADRQYDTVPINQSTPVAPFRNSASPTSTGPASPFAINMGADALLGQTSAQNENGQQTVNMPDENQNVGPHGHPQGPAGQAQQGAAQAQGISLRVLVKWLEGSAPFILLLLAKNMYNHRLGILVLAGLFGTFYHTNNTVKKHVAQRENQSDLKLIWIIAFLTANIVFIYYVFDDQQLYKSLLCQMPGVKVVDMWTLLWIVGITDFVIKFAVIILKSFIAVLPRVILPYKRRGKYYMLVEYVCQFYRCLTPIMPWIYFLLDDEHGGQFISYLLLFIYAISKGQQVLSKFLELKQAAGRFKLDVSYGSCPSSEDISQSDNACPICQDKFTDPVKLSCKHVFCEDCVSMWFDRERTCPMCRANIVDNPVWRDGTTSANLQFY